MDGLPAWPALFLVRLELVIIFWFVEDKCFAVGTEGFLFPVFLGPVRVRRGAYVCVCHHLILYITASMLALFVFFMLLL